MMTSYRESTIVDACGRYAAFLRKPFKIPQVVEVVARLIGKEAKTD